MTAISALPKAKTKKAIVKPKITKPAELFISKKLNAEIVKQQISIENAKRSKRQDFLHLSAQNLIFSLVHIAKIEIGKLYVNPKTKSLCELYLSDEFTSLPVMTNNAQLSEMLFKPLHAIKNGFIVANDDINALISPIPSPTSEKPKKVRRASSILEWRKRLEAVGFIERTVHFVKTEQGLVESENGRSGGYQLWINKKWFGLGFANNIPNSLTDLSPIATPSNGLISRDSGQSTQYLNLINIKSFEKEESSFFPFLEKNGNDVVSANAEIFESFFDDEFGNSRIANRDENTPQVAPPPHAAENSNKNVQLADFAEKTAALVESVYDKFQKTKQVRISKDNSLNAPLSEKQRNRVLRGCLEILAYFGQKMPLSDAFDTVTDGVKATVKDLKRNPENYIYLPENFLAVDKGIDGNFRMKSGLRYVCENWNCSTKTVEKPQIIVNQQIEDIFSQYFTRLSKYGLTEKTFRTRLSEFFATGKLIDAKNLIDTFLGKANKLGDNKIAYLIGMWNVLKNQNPNDKVDFAALKQEKQMKEEREANARIKQAQQEAALKENAMKAVKMTQKENSYADDLAFAKQFALKNISEFERIVKSFAALKRVQMTTENAFQEGLFFSYIVPMLVSTIKLQFPNEFQ